MDKKKQRNVHLLSYIQEEKQVLIFGGLYPPKHKNKILTCLPSVFLVNFALLYNLLEIICALQNIFDLTTFSTIVLRLLRGLSYTCNMANLLIFRNNVLVLDGMLDNPTLAELDTDEEEQILRDNLKSSRVLKMIYKVYSIGYVFLQVLYPLFNNSGSKMNYLWFPFNPDEHYLGVYCFEVVELIVLTCFNAAINLLMVTMMNLCAAQFILLEHRLQRIMSVHSEEGIQRNVLQQLQKYIDHHNYIYSFTALVETTFSLGIFYQMGCSVLVVAIGVLKAVIMPKQSMEFLIMVIHCVCMIYEIALYCFYGQKILNASNKIAESCYMLEWYQYDADIQEYLVMIMNRANKSVIMKAVGLFPLTLETLMSICNSTYSFFAILMHIHNVNDETC